MNERTSLQQCCRTYYRDRDMNCAEAVILGADQWYELHLDPQSLRTAAGFGGGLSIGSLCGALSGAVMALGALFVRERAHEDETIKTVTAAYLEEARRRFGSLLCIDLKAAMHTEEDGCLAVVLAAAGLLEEIVQQYDHLRIIREHVPASE